jgi:hypothetical protein
MLVVDHEPHAWFLLRDALGYVLDVNCGQSAVGFSIVMRLTADEARLLELRGHTFADELARSVHDAPRAYADRHLGSELEADTTAAVKLWRAEGGESTRSH